MEKNKKNITFQVSIVSSFKCKNSKSENFILYTSLPNSILPDANTISYPSKPTQTNSISDARLSPHDWPTL